MKSGVKACLSVILIASLPLSVIGSESQSKFRLGFQAGGSVGLSSMFSRHSWGGHMTRDDDLDVHFGGYVQYDFHRLMSLQLGLNYQNGSCDWTFFDPPAEESSGTDPYSIFLINSNAVFNSRRGGNVQFAFIVGGGLAVVHDLEGDDSGFNIGGEPALKVFLSSDSLTALIFGAAFQAGKAEFIRFTAGLEFGLPGSQNRRSGNPDGR